MTTDEPPASCGAGIAQHAAIPAAVAVMFEGLAETFALHRQMLKLEDPAARQEDEVYRDLHARWATIARQTAEAAAMMAAQRTLPMAAHDESAWGEAHLRAFEKFVKAQSELMRLLQSAAIHDEALLAGMTEGP